MGHKIAEWFFIALQVLASALQLVGTFMFLPWGSNLFAWSLSAVVTPLLLASLSWLRVYRRTDRQLSLICGLGNAAWAFFIVFFGTTQPYHYDLRVLLHATAAFALALLSFRNYAQD